VVGEVRQVWSQESPKFEYAFGKLHLNVVVALRLYIAEMVCIEPPRIFNIVQDTGELLLLRRQVNKHPTDDFLYNTIRDLARITSRSF